MNAPGPSPLVSPAAPTRPRVVSRPPGGAAHVNDFMELLQLVRTSGLDQRCPGFYATLSTGLLLALAGLAVLVARSGASWWQLLTAAALGLVLVQLGFVAHEAAHRQIFTSTRANDRLGRVLGVLIGVSYSSWKLTHNRHHANPNVIRADPSIRRGVFAFTVPDAVRESAVGSWFTARQGFFLPPLLLFAGFELHVGSLVELVRDGRRRGRFVELGLILLRHAAYLTALGLVMPSAEVAAFLMVQVMAFGLVMAAAFVPNHVGMPVLEPQRGADFLRRQVLTSRNIQHGVGTWWMGGLDYQIEHHLFPSMPRPQLRRARPLVQAYCRQHAISYRETGLWSAYGDVVGYLNDVGLAAADWRARCPVAAVLGR